MKVISFSRNKIEVPAGAMAVGIDLGTTHSVVSVFEEGNGKPETLVYEGSNLVPSLLYWDAHLQQSNVGFSAKEFMKSDPGQVIKSTKRHMGTIGKRFSSHSKKYTPEDAATLILTYLMSHDKFDEEKEKFGCIYAVITVPAHFGDAARRATMASAEAAGICVIRVINEPTAAALAYSMLPDARKENEEILSVFDFGGGTFDVSVVEREELIFNVLASEGDVHLGGDDIDEALANYMLPHVKPIEVRYKKNPELMRALVALAENAKIKLQTEGMVKIQSSLPLAGTIDVELDRDVLEAIAAPLIQRTLELTEKSLHAAKKRSSELTRILLVGGSTRLSLVQKLLAGYFPTSVVDARLEPDLAVSWGASLQAAIILGLEPGTILVDVCSHTLGIGVAEDAHTVNENVEALIKKYDITSVEAANVDELQNALGDNVAQFNKELLSMLKVAPIIFRNSALPARRSEFFSTIYENQPAVQVVVVQGEGDSVGENNLIGTFFFTLQKPVPKGTRCEIQLTYDVNGMIHVMAKQLGTDNIAEAHFDSRTGEVAGWTPVDQSDSETSSVVQPRPQGMNALLVRAKRSLMKLSVGSVDRQTLLELIDSYSSLISETTLSPRQEEELEQVEETLLNMIDKK